MIACFNLGDSALQSFRALELANEALEPADDGTMSAEGSTELVPRNF